MTKLIVAFRNFAKARKKGKKRKTQKTGKEKPIVIKKIKINVYIEYKIVYRLDDLNFLVIYGLSSGK